MLTFKKNTVLTARLLVTSLLLMLSACSTLAGDAINGDYMVTVNRPNNLHLIDLGSEKVIRTCKLPAGVAPGTVVMSPDKLTAYVLGGRFDRIFGVDINNCNLIFDARFSHDNIRIKSFGSLAVSADGTEVYTIHNPVRIMNDHYEILDTRFAAYRVADGVGAKPVRTYAVPRQINIMATARDGRVYLSGADVYVMDPLSGALETAIVSRNGRREGYGQPDVVTVWPVGRESDEFVRMYTVPKFNDSSQNLETAEWWWGYEKVELSSGKVEVKDFAPLEHVFFTGMHRPGHPDEFYAVLTQLKRHKVSEQRVIKGIDLERTYYCINFSTDGSKIYLGGTYNDIAVYDAESLTKLSNIVLPGGDMSMATPQVFSLPRNLVVEAHEVDDA